MSETPVAARAMTSDLDTMQLLRRLWAHVAPRRRLQLAGFVVLVAAGAIAEVASLGLVIPFLAVITDPGRIADDVRLQPFLHALQIENANELLLPLTVWFCAMGCLSAGVRFGMVWAQVRLGAGIGNDLGEEAFRRTLHQPYLVHVSRNSSEVIAALMSKTDTTVYYLLIPLLNLAGSALVGAAIVAFMLWTSPVLTAGASIILGGTYAVIVALNRPRIAMSGQRVAEGQTLVAQVVQEGLGGIRDVLLGGHQAFFVQRFQAVNRSLRNSIGTIAILGTTPRYIVDALTIITVGAVVFHAARGPGGIDAAIPTLGALALAIQRLMPMVQQAYYASTALHGGRASLGDLLALLDQPLSEPPSSAGFPEVVFERNVEFRGVNFCYPGGGRPVLLDASVSIPRGGRVGVIGETGSGKSTFLDLAMGLILPVSGEVLVDGVALNEHNVRSWQRHVAHVPQHIFLADASIADNIAFGEEGDGIDLNRVRAAARLAQLEDTILSWPEQYATRVGERGVQLSGGQRQRVGIARALYQEAELLVLDEATSALDDDTEDALVQALERLGRSVTVLTVAHRKRSLRGCDFVLEIGRDGSVRRLEGGDAR